MEAEVCAKNLFGIRSNTPDTRIQYHFFWNREFAYPRWSQKLGSLAYDGASSLKAWHDDTNELVGEVLGK